MGQAETLLETTSEVISEHVHPVTDSDSYFIINPDTREINNTAAQQNVLMQYDHDSERFTFEVARYVEGHDMSQCNRVRVHYINVDGQTGTSRADVVELDDLKADPENSDVVICSWLISRQATQLVGSLSFVVQYMCVSDSGTVDYEWRSDIYSNVIVKKSLNNTEAVAIEYSDILEQWYVKLFGTDNSTTSGSIPIPTSASIGQVIVVKATDETGKPTEWECVDPWVLTDTATNSKYKLSVVDGKLTMDAVVTESEV